MRRAQLAKVHDVVQQLATEGGRRRSGLRLRQRFRRARVRSDDGAPHVDDSAAAARSAAADDDVLCALRRGARGAPRRRRAPRVRADVRHRHADAAPLRIRGVLRRAFCARREALAALLLRDLLLRRDGLLHGLRLPRKVRLELLVHLEVVSLDDAF